jgi:hypothetical protein
VLSRPYDLLAHELGEALDRGVRGYDQHARIRSQGSGPGEDVEPGPSRLRRDVGDVASGRDVDLALLLVGDDRRAAGYLLDLHVQSLLGEEAVVLRNVQARQVGGRQRGHYDVLLLGPGQRGQGRAAGSRGASCGQDSDRCHDQWRRIPVPGPHSAPPALLAPDITDQIVAYVGKCSHTVSVRVIILG